MALLTPSELAWLKGEKRVAPGYARFLRHSIRKKLAIFSESEWPLILSSGIVSDSSNGSNALVAQNGGAKAAYARNHTKNGALGGNPGGERRFRTHDLGFTKPSLCQAELLRQNVLSLVRWPL